MLFTITSVFDKISKWIEINRYSIANYSRFGDIELFESAIMAFVMMTNFLFCFQLETGGYFLGLIATS